MGNDSKPILGFLQPTFGVLEKNMLASPKKEARSKKSGPMKRPKYTATRTRRVIAANVLVKMELRYRGVGDKFKALAEDAGTSLSTIQRATQPDSYSTGISVDVLTQIAMALRCEPYELLMPPGLVLDTQAPP
jgi:hypothetical protein